MLRIFSIFAIAASLVACSSPTVSVSDANSSTSTLKISSSSSANNSKILTEALMRAISESGTYTTRDSVAAYLCKFENCRPITAPRPSQGALRRVRKNFFQMEFQPVGNLGSHGQRRCVPKQRRTSPSKRLSRM